MKKIPLTQGEVALVDNEDYARLMEYTWYLLVKPSGRFYAARNEYGKWGKSSVTMQRDIMNHPIGKRVTFKNKNSLDCQKENLVLK